MYTVPHVTMEQQVRNLNCGRYCLEALMRWRHGTKFGKHTTTAAQALVTVNGRSLTHCRYGIPRSAHSQTALAHINDPRAYGFDPNDYTGDYGLKQLLPVPDTAAEWARDLRAYGPILVGGCIGAVEVFRTKKAGHQVLVVGIDDGTDEIIYLDPLGSVVKGGLAFFGVGKRDASAERRMGRASFVLKMGDDAPLVSCPPLAAGGGGQNG